MNLYLIPNVGDFSRLADQAARAKVPLLTPSTIRELILTSSGENTAIASVRAEDLLVLNRYAPTLMDEMPTIVMSVPGLVYSGEWMALASAFPSIDWVELERKISKSGHMATSPEDLPGRSTTPVDERPRLYQTRVTPSEFSDTDGAEDFSL